MGSRTVKGYFYRVDPSFPEFYLLEIGIKQLGTNTTVTIWEMNDHDFNLANGEYIFEEEYNLTLVASLDIWGKYYFPTWDNSNNQFYHVDKGEAGAIEFRARIMQKALDLGLKLGKIKVY